ncbi:4796_t:CDS:2 [Diversispora eburnea]|uniref:4796_t:CDS:1 n=1 Tax=Diversispora eburnea TaxID=1213867 RepID=A0A9N9CFE6_9GLOM|nr:4796_t:CDS:2 [Diversispora eburnea]
MVYDRIHFTILIIPTGLFFGYRSMPNGISISKNEPVIDVEHREYVYMEPEKKVSDYFNSRPPAEITIHILIEEA